MTPLSPATDAAPSDIDIARVFQAAWDEFGDGKSTEFLIAITADRCGIDYDRVVDALAATAELESYDD